MRIILLVLVTITFSLSAVIPNVGNNDNAPVVKTSKDGSITVGQQTGQSAAELAEEKSYRYVKSFPNPTLCPSLEPPVMKDGYGIKVKKIDIASGETSFYVYEVGANNEFIDVISYINKSCKTFTEVTKSETSSAMSRYASDFNEYFQVQDHLNSLERKYFPKDSSFGSVNDTRYLTTTQFLIACLMVDGTIIDIESSLKLDRIVLKQNYTIQSNLVKSDSNPTEELAKSILLFWFNIIHSINELSLELKTTLAALILPFTLMYLGGTKISKALQSIADYDDLIEKGVMFIGIFFIFFISNSVYEHEDKQINQTTYQQWSTNIIKTNLVFAQSLNKVFATTYVGFEQKNLGKYTQDQVEAIVEQNLHIDKVLPLSEEMFNYCTTKFDVEKLRYLGQGDWVFPASINAVGKYAGVKRAESGKYVDPDSYTSLTIESCAYNERYLHKIKEIKAANLENLKRFESSANTRDTKESIVLKTIAEAQYKNAAELGVISVPLIASTRALIKSLDIFDRKENPHNDNTNFIEDMFTYIPYLMLPSADSVYNYIDKTLGGESGNGEKSGLLDSIKGLFNHNPVGAVLNMATSAFRTVAAFSLTIVTFEKIIEQLPILALMAASVLVVVYYFLSIAIYYLVSPFMIVYALAAQQSETLKRFVIKGIVLSIAPLLIVLSVILAVLAIDLIDAIGMTIINKGFNGLAEISRGNFSLLSTSVVSDGIGHYSLFTIKGILYIFLKLVSVVTAFYLVFRGKDMILRMFGFEDTSVDINETVGSTVENKTGDKWTGAGVH